MMQLGASRRLVALPHATGDPMETDRGLAIRKCRQISAADKWAWRYLERLSRSGLERVQVTAAEIGEDEGRTSDAGRQRLRNLAKHGLITIVDHDAARGVWLVEVHDPCAILGSARAAHGDPQLELEFEPTDPHTAGEALSESRAGTLAGDAPSSPAGILTEEPPEEPSEEPPEDPRSTSGLSGPSGLSVVAAQLPRPWTIGRPSGPSAGVSPAKDLGPADPRRGTSGGTSTAETSALGTDDFAAELARRRNQLGIARPADELDVNRVVAIASSVARAAPTERENAANRERWIETIRRRVNDPALKTCVMVKVACAVVYGEIKPSTIEQIFGELDKHRRAGTLRNSPGIYFVRAAQSCFARHGLTWKGYGSRPTHPAERSRSHVHHCRRSSQEGSPPPAD
jgi:hypothetical protein